MAGIQLGRFNEAAVRALLTSPGVRADIERRTAAIRAACDAESSWDKVSYESAVTVAGDRVMGRVWSISANLDESHERHVRMIRNLDAAA